MIRQNLSCANSKINGCQGNVSQRGNILCETCTENRKNLAQSKRDYEVDQLMAKYIQTEQELSKYKTLYEQLLVQCEKEKSILNEQLTKMKLNEIKNSQVSLDNEKLIIDNKQLELLNQSLTKQIEELSKTSRPKQPIPPQTARNPYSKIPELIKRTSISSKNI